MRSKELELESDADLIESLQEASSKEQSTGFVIGVVGNLSKAVFQCPERTEPTVVKGNLEIITINGKLSPEKVHLHICISDKHCKVWGGHLEKGTKVLKKVNILIGFLDNKESGIRSNYPKEEESKIRVEVAILPNCPWSKRAIKMLRTLAIPHKVSLIENDSDYKVINERTGFNTFPQIFIDEELIGGYEELANLYNSGQLEHIRN